MKKINVLLSTFFGYGYLTKIPGTLTSAVTAVFIYIAYEILGYTDLKFSIIFFILFLFIPPNAITFFFVIFDKNLNL